VLGYRLALILTGSLALILADRIPWPMVYAIMAGTLILPMIATFWAPEPVLKDKPPQSLRDAVVFPFMEFFTRVGPARAFAILGFIVLYKLSDYLASAMATPFMLEIGFTQTQIGAMMFRNPTRSIQLIAVNALVIAFLSATYDIAFDAYRTDVLEHREMGAGASMGVLGYRLALILTGSPDSISGKDIPLSKDPAGPGQVVSCPVVGSCVPAEKGTVKLEPRGSDGSFKGQFAGTWPPIPERSGKFSVAWRDSGKRCG